MRPATTTATVRPDPHTNELSAWNLDIIETIEYITNYIKYAYSYTATSTWVCLRAAEQGGSQKQSFFSSEMLPRSEGHDPVMWNEGVFRRIIYHCCVPSFQTNKGSNID